MRRNLKTTAAAPDISARSVAAAAWASRVTQFEMDDEDDFQVDDDLEVAAEIDEFDQIDTEENAYLARLHASLDD